MKSLWQIISLWQIMTPRGVANLDPRVTIGRNYKGLTKYCFTQNLKALDLMTSEKKIFFSFFSYKSMEANDPMGRGQLGPQGHDWQDL